MLRLKDLNVKLESGELDNGIKIVNFRREGAPLAVQVWFFAGARFDQIEGTAHFLEHMLVAGSKKFPTKDKLAMYVEGAGGSFNAHTGTDTLVVEISMGDPRDVDVVAEVLEEAILNPIFDEKTIGTERGSIIREQVIKRANPTTALGELSRPLFYQKTILDRSVVGTEESVRKIKKTNLVNFYQENILSGQVVLVTSGGVSMEVLKENFRFLEGIKYGMRLPKVNLAMNRGRRVWVRRMENKDQVSFIYAFRIGDILDEFGPATVVLSRALAGGQSSSLMKRLRYDRGLIYGLGIWLSQFFDGGDWGFRTSVSKANLQESIGIIQSEIRRVIDDGLDEDELNFVKNKIIKSGRLNLQDSDSWVDFHAYRQFVESNKPWTFENYIKEIEEVTNEQIRKAARKYLDPRKSYLAVVGQIDEREIRLVGN